MSARSASRRVEVFRSVPVSSEVSSPDAEYSHPSGPRPLRWAAGPERGVHTGEQFDRERRAVLVEWMQRVGKLTGLLREVLEHQHEAPRERVERRTVGAGDAGQARRELLVEPDLGVREPAELTHQPGRGGLGGQLDEHRLGNAVARERQPGP